MCQFTHLSLFSGIGGMDFAAEAAGFETVGQCECADFPIKILEKHWPDVQRWKDIREITQRSFYEKTGLSTLTVISGGFPCQPFSSLGKRRGKSDDRYLWPEMLRVISEIRPAWIVGENVVGIVSLALDDILDELANTDYETQTFIIPACAVDAPHRRDRVAIIACDTNRKFRDEIWKLSEYGNSECSGIGGRGKEPRSGICGAHNGISRWMDSIKERWRNGTWGYVSARKRENVPYRKERLKALGNAVVPEVFYPIFQSIAEIESKNGK